MFEELKKWCLDVTDQAVMISKRERVKYPSYDLLCDQFSRVKTHSDFMEKALVEDKWSVMNAQNAWEEVEKLLNGIQHWCTIQNIKHFAETHPQESTEDILHFASRNGTVLYRAMYTEESGSYTPPWPNIAGASTSHYPEDRTIPRLCKAGILNPQIMQDEEFLRDLRYIRKANWQARDGGRGATAEQLERTDDVFVPKLTDQNVKDLIYPKYENVIKTLRAAITEPELKKYIPLPLNDQRLEIERKRIAAEQEQEAVEGHLATFSNMSPEKKAQEMSEFMRRAMPDKASRAALLEALQKELDALEDVEEEYIDFSIR